MRGDADVIPLAHERSLAGRPKILVGSDEQDLERVSLRTGSG
jgi:hypothetical protein